MSAQDIARAVRPWINDPVLFVNEAFGVNPSKWQAETLRAIVDHNFIAVRSAHGVGKSALLSWAVLWLMCTRFPCKIPCTAPTGHQLSDVLWSEMALWLSRMPEALRDQFIINTERLSVKGAEMLSFAVARTSRKENPDAFQGFHGDNLIFLIDEASGVPEEIFQVGEGAMSTPGAKTIMVGNPTKRTGYFYDAFHKMRDFWWCKKVSAMDMEGEPYYSTAYADRMAAKWGEDSNVYRVRVLGEFPIEDEDSVIPYWQVEAAVTRDIEPIRTIQPVWGLDVARFGDCKTALAKRQANVQLEPIKTWRKRDTMEVAGLIFREYEETPKHMLPSEILVDAIGVGAGVVDRLREMGLPARGVNVSESPSSRKDMNRLRDELWWKAREWFEQQDVKILDDEGLIGQLTSMGYDAPSGKVKVWSKDKLRSSGKESPDEADSWVLTFAGIARHTSHTDVDRYGFGSNVVRMRKRPSGWYTR